TTRGTLIWFQAPGLSLRHDSVLGPFHANHELPKVFARNAIERSLANVAAHLQAACRIPVVRVDWIAARQLHERELFDSRAPRPHVLIDGARAVLDLLDDLRLR